jgi:hypothetical protein
MGALKIGFLLLCSACACEAWAGNSSVMTEADTPTVSARDSSPAPPSSRAIRLTPDEYRELKDIIDQRRSRVPAGAFEVAATFAAVQVPKVLLGMAVFLTFLLIVRRMFRPLWDWDVEENPVPSAIVLGALILGGSVIVYALVSA